MDRNTVLAVGLLGLLFAPTSGSAQEGDRYAIHAMQEFNGELKALWMDLRVEQIEFLGAGNGRASSRLHSQPFRWVPGDARRRADGTRITYLVDGQDLAGSGLAPGAAELAIDRAMKAWSDQTCLRNAMLVKRPSDGADPDLFDSAFGYGGVGDYRLADIVHAGFLPPAFFDDVSGPGGGDTILAFSVTFVFVGPDGEPTDVDHDGYMDTAANEIYYNSGFSWLGADAAFDLESVALHESGHSLGLGHVGPPLDSAMGPVYAGVRNSLSPVDHSGLCSVWGSWPQ